jgi:hypothetical protein
MEFPKTLAAAKKAKGAEWSLADALFDEVGQRGSDGRFVECQAYLAEHGIDYKIPYLKDLHRAARTFPQVTRVTWLTPRNAIEAGSPDVVEAAIEMKREKAKAEGVPFKPPTQREMGSARRSITHHARAASGKRQMPSRNGRATSAKAPTSELRRAANVLALGSLAGHAAADGRKFVEQIAGRDLDDVEREALLEDVELVLDTWKVALSAVKNPLGNQVERYLEGAS